MSITYEDLAVRLTPEAESLFRQMVDLHLGATGDRMFLQADTMGGSFLKFCGKPGATIEPLDRGAIEDLASYGLLQCNWSSRGTPNYRVGGEALAFHRWLVGQAGAATAQVEDEVLRSLGSKQFAQRSPQAAHHLNEAFELLWGGKTDDQTVSEIGDHLRKALMDATSEVLGDGGPSEDPVSRLKASAAARGRKIGEREAGVLDSLVAMAKAVLSLDHRLNHIRDEADKNLPLLSWDEARRAAFVTALTCYELDRLAG